ncbi:MAG: hypothetical protein LBN04_12665 [Oscillospiraceae bacterium]|jgi:uncharacterized protein YgiM (DUF1202 family)|nr:hypothetical protein [Oscillospiraceae bacterium]
MKHRFRRVFLCWLAACLALLCMPTALGEGINRHGKTEAEWAQWQADNQKNPSYMLHFADEWPEEMGIAPDLEAAGVGACRVLDGYASRRFGRWMHAEAVLQDETGYLLLAAMYLITEERWMITVSRQALRQDALPILVPEGVRYGYDTYQISQYGGCGVFELIYPDATYRWYDGGRGWRLSKVNELSVSFDTITRADDHLFNTQPTLLEDFDIATFPTTFAQAKALSDASEYADNSRAVTTNPPEMTEIPPEGMPVIRLLEAPSADADLKALVFDRVEADVLEHRDAYVRIAIGTLEGWMRRDCLLIGTERAAEWSWLGQHAGVYVYGLTREQPLYPTEAMDTQPLRQLHSRDMLYVQAMSPDGSRYLIRTGEGQLGWMPFDTVSHTSNFYDAWIYSEDPTRRLNLRTGPGKQYDSIGKYYSGVQVINLLSPIAETGWTHVIIHGNSGWVDASFLLYYADYVGRDWLPPLRAITAKEGAALRDAPESSGQALSGQYPKGTMVEVMGVMGEWAHVRLRDGLSGYMPLKAIGGEPKQADPNRFRVQERLAMEDYNTILSEGFLEAGTEVTITTRPTAEWQSIYSDDNEWIGMEYVANPKLYLKPISDQEQDGGFAYADDLNFWGE